MTLKSVKSSICLAMSIALLQGYTQAEVPVNTVNNGPIIHGGNYFNTADGQTTFTNSGHGGLWLQSGSTLRGLEVDANGVPNLNGGTVHLVAPNAVVRLDGNIDVHANQRTDQDFTVEMGNGGKVFIDAAYLFQKGNIYASGNNGGVVQFNVGSVTIANGAVIDVHGAWNQGGVININASGVVDIGRQAILNTTGNTTHILDTNVINIEGGLVNVEGRLIANGVYDRGGTIRLVSAGQTDLTRAQDALQDGVNAHTFSAGEAQNLTDRLTALKSNYNGDVRLASGNPQSQAILEANGGNNGNFFFHTMDPTDPIHQDRAPEGGSILVTAARDVLNGGKLSANGTSSDRTLSGPENGGNGGTINFNAGRQIVNGGRLEANGGNGKIPYFPDPSLPWVSADTGHGGNGGLIALSYRGNMHNTGLVQAIGGNAAVLAGHPYHGGNGGLIIYGGAENPTGSGINDTLPGLGTAANGHLGTIVIPDPQNASNQILGIWDSAKPVEVAVHGENLFIFNRSFQTDLNNISSNLDHSVIRSIYDQLGNNGLGYHELLQKSDLISTSNPAYNSEVIGSLSQDVPLFRFRNLTVTGFSNALDNNSAFELSQYFGTTRPFAFTDNAGQTLSLTPIFSMQPFNTVTLLHDTPITMRGDMQFGGGLTGGHFSSISLQGDSYSYGSQLTVNGTLTGGSAQMAALGGGMVLPGMNLQGQRGGSFIVKSRDILFTNSTNLSGNLAGGTEQYFSGNNISINTLHQFRGGSVGGNLFAKSKGYIVVYLPAYDKSGGQVNGKVQYAADQGAFEITPCTTFCD